MQSSLLLRRALRVKPRPPIPALPFLPWMMAQLPENAPRPLNLPLVSKRSPVRCICAVEDPLHIDIWAPSLPFIPRPLLVLRQLFHLCLNVLLWSLGTVMPIQLWTSQGQIVQLSSGNGFSLKYLMKISLDSSPSIVPKSAKSLSGTHYQTISYFAWSVTKVTVREI
ncbi:hypothetical protein K503DRAFT_498813 [Rhizopogon vinicolor AM-OR11-026]|uniref:Uncharacterized protein n=1 Tax=Rhizopogon vinicolor AM-OR11-026 TaxID=1314800 RepID=A0A1B7NH30_9AGAM|nr:hypothetical protein K503DRAFT_498813 [Rhizopogon vinicolor AM-OR11-026]